MGSEMCIRDRTYTVPCFYVSGHCLVIPISAWIDQCIKIGQRQPRWLALRLPQKKRKDEREEKDREEEKGRKSLNTQPNNPLNRCGFVSVLGSVKVTCASHSQEDFDRSVPSGDIPFSWGAYAYDPLLCIPSAYS